MNDNLQSSVWMVAELHDFQLFPNQFDERINDFWYLLLLVHYIQDVFVDFSLKTNSGEIDKNH